jgi:hypothetical protein
VRQELAHSSLWWGVFGSLVSSIKNRALLWVNFETPGGVIHSSGGINILFSFFGSSLMSVDFQQRKFCLAVAFITEYDD